MRDGWAGLVWARAGSHWEKVLDAHARARESFPNINAPSELFVDPETLRAETARFAPVRFSDLSHEPGDARPIVVRSSPPAAFGRRIELWRKYLGELLAERGTTRHADLHATEAGRIHVRSVTQLEISSTDLRDLIVSGRDPRYLLPDAVREIIRDTGCYTRQPTR